MSDEEREFLAMQLEQDLLKLYGSPILTIEQLQRALNYRSVAAVKQAIQRQTLPVHIFELPNRRGRFALVRDVCKFLASQACARED
ncbi:hypothetical protein NJR55_01100 [Idiomarina sp. M1R2S28]|uniref:Uncharacterized protein n=2 Tax=Idiomarina TaxID=135575 RepID=A0A9X2FTE4_9GAMM|nr:MULTISPECIES: hypothetical protein [Idiomarina]MCP1338177.1 hypothetical protein [Idiomarina rhizosphaerae]MEC7643585.1 hypothetical protein [Pseudomonadota bacterium]